MVATATENAPSVSASASKAPSRAGDDRPPTWKVWVLASRPHTLTASISPVLVGWSVTAALCSRHHATATHSDDGGEGGDRRFSLSSTTLSWALFCVLIQLGTNLHNDYADYVKGADDESRVGQARATQRGWLTPRQTAGGSTACLVAAISVGLGLARVTTTHGESPDGRWDPTMVAIVTSSAFCAVAYTGGPYPLGYVGLPNLSIGYSGLGDVFVFLYFGLVAVMTVPYLCVRGSGDGSMMVGGPEFPWDELKPAFVAALPVGFLATAIIVVNNLRDRHTDVGAGKRTLAVRCGATFCRVEYALLILGSYAVVVGVAARHSSDDLFMWGWGLLPMCTIPLAIAQFRAVSMGEKDGRDLNPHVGGTARLQFFFCLLWSASIRMTAKAASWTT